MTVSHSVAENNGIIFVGCDSRMVNFGDYIADKTWVGWAKGKEVGSVLLELVSTSLRY